MEQNNTSGGIIKKYLKLNKITAIVSCVTGLFFLLFLEEFNVHSYQLGFFVFLSLAIITAGPSVLLSSFSKMFSKEIKEEAAILRTQKNSLDIISGIIVIVLMLLPFAVAYFRYFA